MYRTNQYAYGFIIWMLLGSPNFSKPPVGGPSTRLCSLCRPWGCLLFLHYVTGPRLFKTWGNSLTVLWCLIVRPEIIYLETSWSLTSSFSFCCPLPGLLLDIYILYLYIYYNTYVLVKPKMCCFDSHRCLHNKTNRPFLGGYPSQALDHIWYFWCPASDRLATVVTFCIIQLDWGGDRGVNNVHCHATLWYVLLHFHTWWWWWWWRWWWWWWWCWCWGCCWGWWWCW